MDIDDLINQIMGMVQNPMHRNSIEPFLRDSLDRLGVGNHQNLTEILRQRTEEVDAFRKSAEFWRNEYLEQASALDKLRVK